MSIVDLQQNTEGVSGVVSAMNIEHTRISRDVEVDLQPYINLFKHFQIPTFARNIAQRIQNRYLGRVAETVH